MLYGEGLLAKVNDGSESNDCTVLRISGGGRVELDLAEWASSSSLLVHLLDSIAVAFSID